MNKLKSTIRKSIIAGVTMSTILGMSNAPIAYASVQPADLTYYTTNADGTITGNTGDDSKKDINNLEIKNTTGDKFANAIKADNNTIKVYLANAGIITVSSDISTQPSSSSNNAKAVALEAKGGGTVDLYGSGTINIYSSIGSNTGSMTNPAALAYAFWNSAGDGNTITTHGDNIVINAEIQGTYKDGNGIKGLTILKNTATNSSITIGNGYKVNGKVVGGIDLKTLDMYFANNDYQSGGTSSNAGGSTITVGNGTEVDFQIEANNGYPASVYIAKNGTESKNLYGNNKIVFGDDSKIKINAVGHNPASILAMNQLTQTGATAQIEFGNNTNVKIENTVNVKNSYIYGASNYSTKGQSSITFGDNTNLQFSSKRGEGKTGAINYVYGAHEYMSVDGQIAFGNSTTFDLSIKDKEGGVFGVYHEGSNKALTTFGNNTTITVAAEGISAGTSITASGIWHQQTTNSKVQFGDNTTINAQVNGGTNVVPSNATGAYLLYAAGSELTFGTNTTINSRSVGTSGLASGIYLYGGSNNKVTMGSGTRITAHGTGTKNTKVTASGIYLTGSSTNAIVTLHGDTFMSITTDKVAGSASGAYAIYDNSDANGRTYVNIDNTDPTAPVLGAGKVEITGDVLANKGTIYLGLNGADSYLNGEISQSADSTNAYTGKVVLFMDNGAKWNLKANSFNADGTPSTLNSSLIAFDTLSVGNNCTIDLTADGTMRNFVAADDHNYRTLRSTNGNFKANGTGNTFIINTDVANNISDTIVLDSTAAGENYIKINYDPALAAGRELNDLGKARVVEQVAGGNFDGTFKVKATVGGLHKYLPIIYQEGDNSWYVKGFTESGPTNTVQLVGKVLENNMALAMQKTLNSDLSRRMGEIRDNPDNAGAWVKISAGENTIGGNSGQQYSSIQGGIDKHIQAKRGSHFVGLAFEHTTTSNSYDIESAGGRGNANMFTLYNTWAGNDGQYYDIVAKTGKLDNRADLLDENFKNANLSYANWMTGVSFEYGVRKQLAGGAYWQPELQLAYSRINGTNYSSTNGVNVSQDAANSLIARLGITLGKKVDKNSNVYITASVLKEFLGKTTTHLTSGADKMSLDTDMSSFWGEIVIGANTKLNSKTDMYIQAATNIGGKVRTKWQAQAGFRWNW